MSTTQTEPTVIRERTVGELVAGDYRRAEVFKAFGIDFCCGGGRTVQAACDKKGIPYQELEAKLLAVDREEASNDQADPSTWQLDVLADYIVEVHHTYVRENLPLLQEFAAKVAKVHGAANPEVVQIADLFDELAAELRQHTMKEERVLFPDIRALVEAASSDASVGRPPFGTVQNPIRMMEHEHDHAGNLMKEIRELSGDYTPPEHACTTYRVLYAKLHEFEEDLHRHVHLENNILFPAAIAREQELTTRP